jgi:hypothetical protein
LALSVEKFAHPPAHGEYPLLQVKPHALPLHAGAALATPVVQALLHVPQLLMFVAVFTQFPLQSVGVEAGQVHTELSHTLPPVHAYPEPHPPQLLLSLVKFTHAPLQSV